MKKNKDSVSHKPDIVISEKGNEQFTEDGQLTNPVMVSEVFPSEEEAKYEEKLLDYKMIPSLKTCIYIWEDKIQVDLHWRDGAEWKKQRYQSLDDMVMMPHLGIMMPLSVIYDGIDVNSKD